jgi:hypothetical protein
LGVLLSLMSATIADVGWLLPLFLLLLAITDVIADVDASRARLVLLSEFDVAGHTDALEILLLLSSDAVAADVKLDQRPIVEGY